MSVETRDREKVGTIQYEAGLMFNTEDEFWNGPSEWFASLADAQAWAVREINKAATESSAIVSAVVWRYRYVPTEFMDEEYGLVLDAAAQRDLNYQHHYNRGEWADESHGDAEWEAQ